MFIEWLCVYYAMPNSVDSVVNKTDKFSIPLELIVVAIK